MHLRVKNPLQFQSLCPITCVGSLRSTNRIGAGDEFTTAHLYTTHIALCSH